MSKFLRSGSGESSSYSSDERGQGSGIRDQESENEADPQSLTSGPSEDDAVVSPLALMSDSSPEAWLGQFLIELGLETRRGTLDGARADAELMRGLAEIRQRASGGPVSPLQMLDVEYVERLRAADWAAWWRAQDDAAKYYYATLALSLLGERGYVADLAAMHRKEANSRIRKDAHYVLAYMLGKPWPGYVVTEGDLQKLAGPV